MKKHTERKGERLKVTGIQYAPGPDADDRVSRALGILLKSATKNAATSEESVNAKKKKLPCQAPEGDSHEPAHHKPRTWSTHSRSRERKN